MVEILVRFKIVSKNLSRISVLKKYEKLNANICLFYLQKVVETLS